MQDGAHSVKLQDSKYHVSLSDLSNVNFVQPAFRPLNTFSIASLIYHGDTATILKGHYESKPVIIETCNRIPFRLVCRELVYFEQDLKQIENIVKIKAITRNTSLGVISIAYENIDFIPWPTKIPTEKLVPLFATLLKTISQIHAKKFSHGCICRSSIYVTPDFKSITLGCFHAAVKTGDIVAFTYDHPCMPKTKARLDARKDDLYSAAMWFLSFFESNPQDALSHLDKLEIPKEVASVIKKLTAESENDRISAEDAYKALQKGSGSSK